MDKKILIMLPGDELGGAEQILKMIAEYHLNNGDYVTIYSGTAEKHGGWADLNQYEKINITYSSGSNFMKGFLRSFLFQKKHRNTLLHKVYSSNVYYTGLLGFYRRSGLLQTEFLIGRESTSIFKRYKGLKLLRYNFFYRLGYKQLDLLICQTQFMKDQFIKGLPEIAAKIKIKVLYNPANVLRMKEMGEQTYQGIQNFSEYIVSAGRLIPEKGFDILISAFIKLLEYYPALQLYILGEGAERSSLEEMIRLNKMEDNVKLIGKVDNVYPYFKRATLCVVSSRIEGFPNVLLQMMSQNANVVSTLCVNEISGIKELPVCKPDDSEELFMLMKQTLSDTELVRQNRFKAFADYLQYNSVDAYMKAINDCLN